MHPDVCVTIANGPLAGMRFDEDHEKSESWYILHAEPGATLIAGSLTDDVDALRAAANATTADCENDPKGTHRVNCDAAIEIARICKERGCRMIFISTEQIFNGKTEPGPFTEDAEPASVTNYGMQKAEVDSWMQQNMEDYLVLRFSWMFGMPMPHVKPSPGIMGNVIKALRTDTPTLFTVNEKRCMTYAQHLADQFAAISELPSGVYHFASQNELSTYDAAKLIGSKLIANAEQQEGRPRAPLSCLVSFRLATGEKQALLANGTGTAAARKRLPTTADPTRPRTPDAGACTTRPSAGSCGRRSCPTHR